MNFREATTKDIEHLAENSVSRGCCADWPEQTDFVYALEYEGELCGIGGIKLLNKTTAWCWMDLTQHGLETRTFTYRVVKEWLDSLIAEKGLKRLMAAVEVDFEEAVRTVEHLGFHKETFMPRFFGDRDGYLYARII